MQHYIVGGAVRDLLMGKFPQEIDLAFSGKVADFLQAEPSAQQVGKSVQVYILHGQEYMPLHNNNLMADLYHRDLTINALALNNKGIIYSHPQSFMDLKLRILRPTTSHAFFDDPLRIYRLARFAATFADFSVHESALHQAKAVVLAHKDHTLPGERVGREFLKALRSQKPSRFMKYLQKMQAFSPEHSYWFVELSNMTSSELIHLGKLKDNFNFKMNLPNITSSESIHLEKLKDNFNFKNEIINDLKYNKLKYNDFLTLGRFMLLGVFLDIKKNKNLKVHPIYSLAQRLALPLRYAKAALHFAETWHHAQNFLHISTAEQVHILLQTHILGISKIYWQVLKLYSGQNFLDLGTQALNVILNVHLPQKWQNKGKFSGEKLLHMRCIALQKFLKDGIERFS